MNGRKVRFVVGAFFAVALGGLVGSIPYAAASVDRSPTVSSDAQAKKRLAGLAIPFVANTGSEDARVAYSARTLGGTLFVTRDGQLVHAFPGKAVDGKPTPIARRPSELARGPGWSLTETLVGAKPKPQEGAASSVRVSRFIGSDAKRWKGDVPTFESVSLGEAWPGIRVELLARGNNVEKLFTVARGADPRRIAMQMRGAKKLEVAADGALVAHTGNGPIAFSAPIAWQEIAGERRPVDVRYALAGKRYGFALGAYDREHPVVIDPILQFTFLGGTANDFVYGLGANPTHLYAAGFTSSTNFPGIAGGAQTSLGAGLPDAFVAMFDGDFNLVQATYFGGNGGDFGFSVAVGKNGDVYLGGYTGSSNLPGVAGGAQPTFGAGSADGFVARLSPDLKTLRQATYVGSGGFDLFYALALDANDNVFLGGTTNSTGFPGVAGGAQSTYGGGGSDLVVVKLTPDLTTRLQATYHGGTGVDQAGYSIAVDAAGALFVTGQTSSTNFPVSPTAAQKVHGGGLFDAFVVKFANDLKSVLGSTLIGGSGSDIGFGLAVNAAGRVYVVGSTESANFPWVAGGAQSTYAGNTDAFVVAFETDLAAPGKGTYIGGSAADEAHKVAINPLTGQIRVIGNTLSPDLPRASPAGTVRVTPSAVTAPKGFDFDGFFDAMVNRELTRLEILSTYIDMLAYLEAWDIIYWLQRNFDDLTLEQVERFLSIVTGSTQVAQGPIDDDSVAPGGARTFKAKSAPKAQPANAGGFDGWLAHIVPPNYQGLWWASPPGSESGWGINFAHQDDTIFATWFTYDLAGKPWWLAVVANRVGAGVYQGDLFTTTGPPFNAVPFDPGTVVETTVGTAKFTFGDGNHATFEYTVNTGTPAKAAITQTKTIVRQEFGPLPRCIWGVQEDLTVQSNFLDLWWKIPAGSESGWGINYTHQGDVIFATWFTYDANGKPWWLAFVANKTGPGLYTGDVFTTSGPPFNAVPWGPVVETTVGTVTLTFTDGNNASFAYTVNGISQVKPITRQIFSAAGTTCR
jgi:hypothetical protein